VKKKSGESSRVGMKYLGTLTRENIGGFMAYRKMYSKLAD
jgi:hypothetical protein